MKSNKNRRAQKIVIPKSSIIDTLTTFIGNMSSDQRGVEGPLLIVENGLYFAAGRDYIEVNVPSGGSADPTGCITLTENGLYDVTDGAQALVDVGIPMDPPKEGDIVNIGGEHYKVVADSEIIGDQLALSKAVEVIGHNIII